MNRRSGSVVEAKVRNIQQFIELDAVATNNLKSIDVRFPLHQLTSVTGVSGSGKSSLVFDTLYAESYRRYVESLSSFARQYLKALPKPAIGAVRHLPPAIAVRQTRSGATNRSTVGTLTEMHDTLRIIYAQASELFCIKCQKKIEKADPDRIAGFAVGQLEGQKILVTAPLSAWENVEDKELKPLLLGQGFTRVWVAGSVLRLDEIKAIKRDESHIVIDRIAAGEDGRKRLSEAAGLALKLGRGDAGLIDEKGGQHSFSRRLRCCGVDYVDPSMALFSFNHPLGACGKCQGFGSMSVVDENKVIPDRSESLATKGVAAWNFGEHDACYDEAFRGLTFLKLNLSLKKKPFKDYTKEEWHWLWHGDGKKFEGIHGYFAWLDTKRYKAHYRIHAARFRKYMTCDLCEGKRLNERALACRVLGINIAEAAGKDVTALLEWVHKLSTAKNRDSVRDSSGIAEAILEAQTRLEYLGRMGLGYLSMDRAAPTLSGGELQRINMSRCLGSILTETLFCLDEPTAGLHARDSANLLSVIRDLKSMGNTVVIVEHERTIIEGSDHYIEIGPKAGHEGGHVVFAGVPEKRPKQSFKTKEKDEVPSGMFLEIKNATVHNLKNVSVKIPVGKVTAVCGVSGSGKTSLIKHTLFPLLERHFLQAEQDSDGMPPSKSIAGSIGPLSAIQKHAEVMLVSQVSLGRSSRSTIGTYLGLMDEIRKILATTEDAKRLKLTPGSFSFNVAGGRCETCRGLGTVVEDLSFLGDMEVVCAACNGRRFQERVLSVQHKGKNLIDILSLTVSEARQFFFDKPGLTASLDAVLDVGMGYVTLGQHTSSFSGGEAQRLKLVQIMRDAKKGKPSILIFDEPTTGLSDKDVQNLMDQFDLLSSKGHTVIVVEHHLDVLRRADWLIEMGPDASIQGGEVVYQGVPSKIGSATRSVTAAYLLDS